MLVSPVTCGLFSPKTKFCGFRANEKACNQSALYRDIPYLLYLQIFFLCVHLYPNMGSDCEGAEDWLTKFHLVLQLNLSGLRKATKMGLGSAMYH